MGQKHGCTLYLVKYGKQATSLSSKGRRSTQAHRASSPNHRRNTLYSVDLIFTRGRKDMKRPPCPTLAAVEGTYVTITHKQGGLNTSWLSAAARSLEDRKTSHGPRHHRVDGIADTLADWQLNWMAPVFASNYYIFDKKHVTTTCYFTGDK